MAAVRNQSIPFPECPQQSNNSSGPHSLEDLISKENKTLNVNVLADSGEEGQVKNYTSSGLVRLSRTTFRQVVDVGKFLTLALQKTFQVRNNQLSFDSDKFGRREKNSVRLRETIDNDLETSEEEQNGSIRTASGNGGKRFKMTNVDDDEEDDCALKKTEEGGLEYSAIKRMRLDSSEREKNVRLAMFRQEGQRESQVIVLRLVASENLMKCTIM